MGQVAIVMNIGVSGVHRNRIITILCLNRSRPACNFIECSFPRYFLPFGANLFQRITNPVRVFVQVLQGDGFGTDMTPTKRVTFIALD